MLATAKRNKKWRNEDEKEKVDEYHACALYDIQSNNFFLFIYFVTVQSQAKFQKTGIKCLHF